MKKFLLALSLLGMSSGLMAGKMYTVTINNPKHAKLTIAAPNNANNPFFTWVKDKKDPKENHDVTLEGATRYILKVKGTKYDMELHSNGDITIQKGKPQVTKGSVTVTKAR